MSVKNAELKWDGNTTYRKDRPIEAPIDWTLVVDEIDGQRAPYVLHKDYGIEINANHVISAVHFSQEVTFPAGDSYVLIENESHVVWNGQDPYTAGWDLAILTSDKTYESEKVWVDRIKGNQTFAFMVRTDTELTATMRVTFFTKWASTNGSMQLKRIDLIEDPGSYRVPEAVDLTGGKADKKPAETSRVANTTTPETTAATTFAASASALSNTSVDDTEELIQLLTQIRDMSDTALRILKKRNT